MCPRRDGRRRRERRLAAGAHHASQRAGRDGHRDAGQPMEELLKVLGDMELDVAQQDRLRQADPAGSGRCAVGPADRRLAVGGQDRG